MIDNKILQYPQGQRTIYYPNDITNCYVINRISKGHIWEKNITKKIFNDCEKGSIAIDIGANIGTHTISMLDSVGDEGIVIAFEPQENLIDCMKKTFEKNNNIILTSKLVSNIDGESGYMSGTGGRSRIPIDKKNYSMKTWNRELKKTITLDNYIDELKITKNISVIKIDVEGHEFEVLEGAINTIDRYKPIIYIEVWKECYEKLLEWNIKNPSYKIEKIGVVDYKLYI